MFTFKGDIKDDDPDWLDKIADLEATDAFSQGLDYTVLDEDFVMP